MTPLIPMQAFARSSGDFVQTGIPANPSSSTKDRIARYILGNALKRGQLKRGSTVIKASSSCTSIAMALVCARHRARFAAVLTGGSRAMNGC